MSTPDSPADQTADQTAVEIGQPAGLAETPSVTGVPSIDSALTRLDGLDGVSLGDHAAVYEQVHADLRDALENPRVDDPCAGDTQPGSPPEG